MQDAMVLVDTAKSAGSTLRDFIFIAAYGLLFCCYYGFQRSEILPGIHNP
jgi:hypothetical protein